MIAWKIIALVTTRIPFTFRARPDVTLAAVHKPFVGQATTAPYVFNGNVFSIGKFAFAMNLTLVDMEQSFFEFIIIVSMRYVDSTYPAV
jgi:hypothetical protein